LAAWVAYDRELSREDRVLRSVNSGIKAKGNHCSRTSSSLDCSASGGKVADEDGARVPEEVYKSLRKGGFPFQTRVAYAFQSESKWQLRATEMPWSDAVVGDQFLDVLGIRGPMFALVECKKMESTSLTFLRPVGMPHSTGLHDYARLMSTVQTSRGEFDSDFHTARIAPSSFESELCVKTGKDQRLLEPDCRLLLHATASYARRSRALLGIQLRQTGSAPEQTTYLPLLVTTARLFTARYDPRDVSLETGSFVADPKETEEVDFIRFTKSFSSAESLTADACTVFVVRAGALVRFLDNVEVKSALG
jgi:hypothetical protein